MKREEWRERERIGGEAGSCFVSLRQADKNGPRFRLTEMWPQLVARAPPYVRKGDCLCWKEKGKEEGEKEACPEEEWRWPFILIFDARQLGRRIWDK